jgi:DNA-binding CsgD family transcriptional regulator
MLPLSLVVGRVMAMAGQPGKRGGWRGSAASGSFRDVGRTIILYALALGLAATALQWLEYRYLSRAFSTEIYIAMLAAGFIALGAWAGNRLTPRPKGEAAAFARNEAAIRSLGLTPRECEILDLLASGESNKELARRLGISPNTVKTHVARLYEKLGVQRRVQAIEKARMLTLIP